VVGFQRKKYAWFDMFYGEYLHRVDEKGRIIIPQKFREELSSSFMLAQGDNKSLSIYPMDAWQRFVRKLQEKPFSGDVMRRFIRKLFSGAKECEVDRQGRLLVPITLRGYANISNEVYIIGVGDKAEIWDKVAWEKYNSETNGTIDSMINEIDALGI